MFNDWGNFSGMLDRINYGKAPPIENFLYSNKIGASNYPAGYTGNKYASRNVFSSKELSDIVKSGYMKAPPHRPDRGKYWTMTDDPKTHIRVPSDKVPVGKAVSSRDVELLNKVTGQYEPIRKINLREAGYLVDDNPKPKTAINAFGKAAKVVSPWALLAEAMMYSGEAGPGSDIIGGR
jgi:hypothetical protein